MQQSHVQDGCDRIGERQKKKINNMAKISEKGTDAPLEKIRAKTESWIHVSRVSCDGRAHVCVHELLCMCVLVCA